MIGTLARGTKEPIFVDVRDSQSTVTDLSASGPTFDILDANNAYKATAVGATGSGMVITCVVDLTNMTTYPEGEYQLFVKFTIGTSVIRKGPFPFTVSGA